MTSDFQGATVSNFMLGNEYHRQKEELAQLENDYNGCLEISRIIFEYQSSPLAQALPISSDTKSSPTDYTSDYEDQRLLRVADYLSAVGEAHTSTEGIAGAGNRNTPSANKSDIVLDSAVLNFLLGYQDEKIKIETELKYIARPNASRARNIPISPCGFQKRKITRTD